MSGFLKNSLNIEFKLGMYDSILLIVRKSCELMVESCLTNKHNLYNHEEKIRNHLLENYLNNDHIRSQIGMENIQLRFLSEVPEHYDSESDTYLGRIDIKVVSNNWFSNCLDYYIIECKRVDGTKKLNQKYITEGVCRFVGDSPLYPSYNNMNLMLAFIVKDVDKTKMLKDISYEHKEKLEKETINSIIITEKTSSWFLCESKYKNNLLLKHLFYDISSIIA